MPETPPQPKRAAVEYFEYPFDGKRRPMTRVIDQAIDSNDALKQFWRSPIWPANTKQITVAKVLWPDE